MRKRGRKSRGKGLLIAALVVVLVALGGVATFALYHKKGAQDYLADAQVYLKKGRVSEALIQLRNAVQREPGNALARYQLATALLRAGDAVSAEKEIKLAQTNGMAETDVLPVLAAAYLEQGKNDLLLDTIPEANRPAAAESEIRTLRGMAYLALRRLPMAESSFTSALAIDPQRYRAEIGLARIDSARQNYQAATARLDGVLAKPLTPELTAEAYLLKGQVNRLQKDSDGAIAAFGKVLEVVPTMVRAHLERAEVLLEQQKDDQAATDIAYVLQRNPTHPLAVHFQALVYLRKGDIDSAYDLLQKQGANLGRFPPSLLLMARMQVQRNQLEAAQTNLTEYLQIFPKNTDARLLLGSLLMRKNMPEQALSVLKEVPPDAMAGDKGDIRVYRMLASASMRAGKVSEAGQWLEKAATVSNTPNSRTQLAIERLSLGQTDAAIKDLDSAIEMDPKASDSRILLIITHMRQGEYDEAERLAKEMEAELPGSPIPDNLLGGINLARGDRADARRYFNSAIAKKPDFLPAQMNIAKLDVVEGKLDDAIGQYRVILDQNRLNVDVMIALAELLQRRQQPAEAVALLKRAVGVDGQAVRPRVALVNLFLVQQDKVAAMKAARELRDMAPEDVDALDALGRAQLANGEAANAVDTYRALVSRAPAVALAHERLAQALVAAGDTAAAETALRTGIAVNSDSPTLAAALVNLLNSTGEAARAVNAAQDWRRRHPTLVAGDLILANVLAVQRQFDEATKVLAEAFRKEPSSTTILALSKARLSAGKSADAAAGLESWLKDRPNDIAARDLLATTYLTLGRYDAAETESERLLKLQPDNPIVLNNLAWLYDQRNEPKALEFAERAHKVLPTAPAVMDTLGYILVRRGEIDRALPLLRSAYESTRQSPEIGFHLAVALNKAGKPQEARSVLETLMKDPRTFDEKPEAKKLLDSLGAK